MSQAQQQLLHADQAAAAARMNQGVRAAAAQQHQGPPSSAAAQHHSTHHGQVSQPQPGAQQHQGPTTTTSGAAAGAADGSRKLADRAAWQQQQQRSHGQQQGAAHQRDKVAAGGHQPLSKESRPGGGGAASPGPAQQQTSLLPLRYGPAVTSRVGALFWPQLTALGSANAQAAKVKATKRSRMVPPDERALEHALRLDHYGRAAAPNRSSALPIDRQIPPSSPRCVLDTLPDGHSGSTPGPPLKRRRCDATDATSGASTDDLAATSTLITEEVVCAMLKPAAASFLRRSGFAGAYASALDSFAELASAYLHQFCLTMRRCADARAQRAMRRHRRRRPEGCHVGTTHILDLLQDTFMFVEQDPGQLLRHWRSNSNHRT